MYYIPDPVTGYMHTNLEAPTYGELSRNQSSGFVLDRVKKIDHNCHSWRLVYDEL